MLLAMSSAQRDRPDAGEAYRSEREDLEVLAILKGHEVGLEATDLLVFMLSGVDTTTPTRKGGWKRLYPM